MIGKIISHYRILEKIGAGGMGVVYKAEDTKLKRFVALKFLPSHLTRNETDKTRFLQEARAAAALNHPNVCTIHEIHDEDENPFIVMEYVEGKNLRERVKGKSGSITTLNKVIDYAVQIAEALNIAHNKGIVHRDIKSENIMITDDGRVKVMDFGLARLRGSAKLTKPGSTAGTVAYMSPEHIGGKEVDARTDIFSFGVVLYEMLTGYLPFKGEYDSAMMYAIVNEEPEPVQKYRTDLSSELLHILNRALEKDPGERYQSVNEMLIDLKRLKRDTDRVPRESLKGMPASGKTGINSKWKKVYGFGLATAAVLMIVVVGFIGRRLLNKERVTQAVRKNSLAVMYFEDRSGEENFGKILAEMLISNLSRCKEIDVISSQYLFDILKNMGMENAEAIDRNIATGIAQKARVQTMLLGSIDRIGTTFNINAQLCDVRSGSVIGPAQTKGSRVEDVYQMVNLLTDDVIRLMGISLPRDSQPLRINDVTTHSYEAYKHYHKGIDQLRRFNNRTAQEEFQAAVRLDTTFAMAYASLAFSQGFQRIQSPLADLSQARETMRLAKKYSGNSTGQERDFVNVFDAMIKRDRRYYYSLLEEMTEKYPDNKECFLWLGFMYGMIEKYELAIRLLQKSIEIDPGYEMAYLFLGYIYSRMNEHEKAIAAMKNYIALLPDVLNTYDSMCDVYFKAGMYDEAYRVCEEALKINPDWTAFTEKQSYIHLFQNEGDLAREKNRSAMVFSPDWRLDLTDDMGCFNMYEGRNRQAEAEFQNVIQMAQEQKNVLDEIEERLVLARFYSGLGKFSEARKQFSEVKKLSTEFYGKSYNTWPVLTDYYWGLADLQQGNAGGAFAAAARMKEYIEKNGYDTILLDFYHLLLAEIDVKEGKPDSALMRVNEISPNTRLFFPRCRMLKADLFAMQGEVEKAIDAYEDLVDHWETTWSGTGGNFFDYFQMRSMVNYKIAQLYEKKGDRVKAAEYYQKALDQWKNADEDMQECEDARARLSILTGEK